VMIDKTNSDDFNVINDNVMNDNELKPTMHPGGISEGVTLTQVLKDMMETAEFDQYVCAVHHRSEGTLEYGVDTLDADFFKVVADHLVTTSGIRPLLHSYAVDAIMEGDTIKGIIMESKSGRGAILADRIIDCTGDADIAYFAGAEYRKTKKGQMMGVTTVINCSGVNKEKFIEYTDKNPATYRDWSRTWDQETLGKEDDLRSPYLDLEFKEARKKGVIPANTQNLGGSWSAITNAGEATNLNLVHLMNVDCTDVEDHAPQGKDAPPDEGEGAPHDEGDDEENLPKVVLTGGSPLEASSPGPEVPETLLPLQENPGVPVPELVSPSYLPPAGTDEEVPDEFTPDLPDDELLPEEVLDPEPEPIISRLRGSYRTPEYLRDYDLSPMTLTD